MRLLKKYSLLLIALFLLVAGYFYVRAVGQTYTLTINELEINHNYEEHNVSSYISSDSIGMARIVDAWYDGEKAYVKIESESPGKAYVYFQDNGVTQFFDVIYIHDNGVITLNDYFGHCNGSFEMRLVWLLYVVAVEIHFIRKYRSLIKMNLYSYKNILYLGLIIFVSFFILSQINTLPKDEGAIDVLTDLMESMTEFGIATLIPVVIIAVIATVSNFILITKEGRNWRNLLGLILGLLLIFMTMIPDLVYLILTQSNVIEVHNWSGYGRFVMMFIQSALGGIGTYIKCILVGTIIIGIKSAKHIPSFNKDYIIILGCQIRKDGTLPPLLQSRVDRAIEFANLQKQATGREIVFVPSGGQGSDEVMPEGEAIKNYLVECKIPSNHILVEDRSTSTEENLSYSMDLIREHSTKDNPSVAFSTTNYHVFRAGFLASKLGIGAEGIGSKTKSYFWLNAFIREFIASLVIEVKTHLIIVGLLVIFNLLMAIMAYISTGVLS